MGIFDGLKSVLGGSKKDKPKTSKKKVKEGGAVVIEEISFNTIKKKEEKTETRSTGKKTPEKDEVKAFMEVTDHLRKEAGLPPVSLSQKPSKPMVATAQKPEPAPVQPTSPASAPTVSPPVVAPIQKPEPASSQPKIPETPPPTRPAAPVASPVIAPPPAQPPAAAPPTPPPKPASPTPPLQQPKKEEKRRTAEEIAKIVKVSTNRLQRELERMLEEELRSRGVKGYKEIAHYKRKLKEFIVEKAKYISDRFVEALQSGVDPREQSFIKPLAKELYAEFSGKVFKTEMAATEEKKSEPAEEDDLLALLGGEEGGGTEEENDEDIFKMLQGI